MPSTASNSCRSWPVVKRMVGTNLRTRCEIAYRAPTLYHRGISATTHRVHMNNRWNDIATAVYGLTDLQFD